MFVLLLAWCSPTYLAELLTCLFAMLRAPQLFNVFVVQPEVLVAWLSKRRQEGVCLWITSSWKCFNEFDQEDESALISVDLLNHCGLNTHTLGVPIWGQFFLVSLTSMPLFKCPFSNYCLKIYVYIPQCNCIHIPSACYGFPQRNWYLNFC